MRYAARNTVPRERMLLLDGMHPILWLLVVVFTTLLFGLRRHQECAISGSFSCAFVKSELNRRNFIYHRSEEKIVVGSEIDFFMSSTT